MSLLIFQIPKKSLSRCALTEEMSRANFSLLLLAIRYQVITKVITS